MAKRFPCNTSVRMFTGTSLPCVFFLICAMIQRKIMADDTDLDKFIASDFDSNWFIANFR